MVAENHVVTKGMPLDPVLYPVGQKATFWNMNSSVWAVWAVGAVRKKEWI